MRIGSMFLVSFLAVSGCAGADDTAAPWLGADQGPTLAKPRYDDGVPPRQVTRSANENKSPGLVDLPRFPSISPDGTQIVFSWRGDLWKVPATGGHAERLTTHPSDDLRSAWSPDGRTIAFDSDRTGYRNIFRMNADGTDVRQVTDLDQACTLSAFGVDDDGNEAITSSARLEGDNYRAPRPYLCSVEGGEIVRLHDAFGEHPKGPSGGATP